MSVLTSLTKKENGMAGHSTHAIDDLVSLQAWTRQLRTIIRPQGLPAILVQLPEFSDEQNQSLSALANRYRTACGCTSGGLFMSVAVVSLLTSYFTSGNTFFDITFPHVVSFVGITVLAVLSGKLLGLLWARWRLLRLATRVHKMVVSATQRFLTTGSI
jgi:hypothetical protein